MSCLLQIYCHLSVSENLSFSGHFSETHGVINYGSGWRKTVVNQCLEYALTFCAARFAQGLILRDCSVHKEYNWNELYLVQRRQTCKALILLVEHAKDRASWSACFPGCLKEMNSPCYDK